MRPTLATLILLLTTDFIWAEQPVDFAADIRPIFRERCFACHGALKQEAGLRVDAAKLILAGGDSGAAVVAKKSAASLLIEKITAGQDERMPPEGQPLTNEQVALVKAWIDQGAVVPKDDKPEEDPRNHWAFQKPKMREVQLGGNPIDALLNARRKERGIQPVKVVDRRLLLRRVYLDLIGLPPTRAEMKAFVEDPSPNAYENAVDRLLDSPQYGERWARHWMDIWRYTDWYGLGAQLRNSQKHIWHWRDWIVESLNEDKGYDRMIVEMLAADEIAPTDQDTLRASGFLARNYYLFNRTTWLDDTIEHTSKAFLGLTMNCCKCHDHKYDPLSQVDYYAMRAIFEPHRIRLDSVPGQTDLEKDGLPRAYDAHPEVPTYLHIRGDAKNPDKERIIAPNIPAVLASKVFATSEISLPAEAHNPALRKFVLQDHLKKAEQEIQIARGALAKAKKQLVNVESRNQSPNTSDDPVPDPKAPASSTGKVFLNDDFSKKNNEVWTIGPGEWKYVDGKLTQSKVGATRAYLRSKQKHPTNFDATMKFKTTGGPRWRSIGLAFDVNGPREKMVYLSAVQPGSKLQISYNQGGENVYPLDAKQDRPVALNQLYEMTIQVRDTLVNVSLDGELALAYQLPVKRETGQLDLIAFDSTVEFHSLVVRELATDTKLVQAKKPSQPAQSPMTVEAAKATVAVAQTTLEAAELKPAMITAAHAADLAKGRSSENTKELIVAAAVAARKYELAKAVDAVARAEQKVATETSDANAKAVATAKANAEKARKAIDNPGEKYTSISASLKALEGPDESAAHRGLPFPKVSTGRRTALAKWVVDKENPLTARVAVNHIWLRHFGQPLVESVTDFGRRAKQPVQLEVLDWLALELMNHDWSMKHIHRLMVTSQTYRLSTSVLGAEAAQKIDPDNEFYWRREPARMQSQVIRDSLLHMAGVLDNKMGGPTIDPRQNDTQFRRSLYFTQSRDHQHKFLNMFDDADILRCYRRSESIVPQQALALANSKLSLSMAGKIAEILEQELGDASDDDFVVAAFQWILATTPNEEELGACREAMTKTKEVLGDTAASNQKARANLIHALLNHNDFVTVR